LTKKRQTAAEKALKTGKKSKKSGNARRKKFLIFFHMGERVTLTGGNPCPDRLLALPLVGQSLPP